MLHTTRYIVTVKGSPLNGHTSHIEKVLLPNGAEHATADIQAQIKTQIKMQLEAQLKAHPEGAHVPIRFIVTVDGSPSKGYTAKVEKVPSPVKPSVVTKEEQERIMASQKLRKGMIINKVENAVDKAEAASRSALFFLNKMRKYTNIENDEIGWAKMTKTAIDTAATDAEAAMTAVMDAEDEIKADILKNDMATMMEEALTMSYRANNIMKDVLDEITPVKEGKNNIKQVKQVKKQVNIPLWDNLLEVKKVTQQAYYLWKDINTIINPSSKGGYRNYRNQTYRKYKHIKYNTLRKS